MQTSAGTVLIVDDDQHIVRASALRLEARGYETICAYSGEEAIEALSRRIPNAIVLDVRMPGMSGLDVLRLVKGSDDTRHIPVIMLSASLAFEEKALDCGAFRYLSKPPSGNVLTDAVKDALAESRADASDVHPTAETAGDMR